MPRLAVNGFKMEKSVLKTQFRKTSFYTFDGTWQPIWASQKAENFFDNLNLVKYRLNQR